MSDVFPFTLLRFSNVENRWQSMSAHATDTAAKQSAQRLMFGVDQATRFQIDRDGVPMWSCEAQPRGRFKWVRMP